MICFRAFPASILRKSTSGRHRPVSYPDGPMTARWRPDIDLRRMLTGFFCVKVQEGKVWIPISGNPRGRGMISITAEVMRPSKSKVSVHVAGHKLVRTGKLIMSKVS